MPVTRVGRVRRQLLLALSVVGAGCSPDPGRVHAPDPLRIVSLVPAATGMLVELGLADRVVGRTLDDRTPGAGEAQPVGRVLTPDLEAVVGLAPDLVLAWVGAPYLPALERLSAPVGARVLALDLDRLDRVAPEWIRVADAAGAPGRGRHAAAGLQASLDSLRRTRAGRRTIRVLWIVGDEPPVAVGPGSFLADLLDAVGAVNVLSGAGSAWPAVGFETLSARDPDLILWGAPQPPPRADAHPWSTVAAVRDGRVLRLDPDRVHEPGPGIAAVAVELAALIDAGSLPANSIGILP